MMIIVRLILLVIITLSCTEIYSARGANSVRRKEEEFMREMHARLTEFSARELRDYSALCKSIFAMVGQEGENKLESVPEEQELTEEFDADDEQEEELNQAREKDRKQCEVSKKEQSLAEKQRLSTKKTIADIVAKRHIGYSTIHTFPINYFASSASKVVLRVQTTQKKELSTLRQRFPTPGRIAFVREQQREQVLALRAQGVMIKRDNFDEVVYGLPPLTQYNKGSS